MTVRQRTQQGYDLQLQEVATCVRKVLDGDSMYKRTSERQSGSSTGIVFYTNVRPDIPLILGTDMYVSLEPLGPQTIVTVTVESQPYMFGDIFGFYDRYIGTFFDRLNEAMGDGVVGQSAHVAVGIPVHRGTYAGLSLLMWGGALLFLGLLLILSIPELTFPITSISTWVLLGCFFIALASFVSSLLGLLRSR